MALKPHGGFIAPEPVHRSKGFELARSGSRYFLEVATFCDLARYSGIDNNLNNEVSRWVSENRHILSDDEAEEFMLRIDAFINAIQEAGEALRKIENGESPEERPGQRGQSGRADEGEVDPSELNGSANLMFLDFAHRITNSLNINRLELAARAYLITAVSSFEILFGSIVRSVYRRNPTALDKSEHSFTLEELTQFGSIDDAREALVARKVDALLMESVDSWNKWLSRTVNLEFPSVIIDWPLVREVFARRNILVHADGQVTARYIRDLQSVSGDTSSLRIGDVLGLPQEYAYESLERLVALGLLMTYAVWMRLYKTERDEGALWLEFNQDELISRKLWLAANLISLSVKLPDVQRSIALRVQLNGWLARKRLHGHHDIENEVRAWDISGLSSIYGIKKSMLLDEEKSDNQLIESISRGEISKFEVATHPLYEEFRKRHSG
jgi:hypothetical protein